MIRACVKVVAIAASVAALAGCATRRRAIRRATRPSTSSSSITMAVTSFSAGGRIIAKGYDFDGLTARGMRPQSPRSRACGRDAWIDRSPFLHRRNGNRRERRRRSRGLGYLGHDKHTAATLLIGGAALQVLGLIMVGIGAHAKVRANGHAADAMNEYNDTGSRGDRCAPRPGR